LTQSLRFVNIVINKGFPLSTFFKMIGLLVPDLIHLISPTALLIAILMTFHRLIVDQEITVLRATGFSDISIAKPVIYLSILMTGVLYITSCCVLPLSFQKLRTLEFDLRNNLSTEYLSPEDFNTFSNLTFYINERKDDGRLLGVFIHSEEDPLKPFYVLAKEGKIYFTEEGQHLILQEGTRYEYDLIKGQPTRLHFHQYALHLNDMVKEKERTTQKPYELSFFDLWNPPPRVLEKIHPQKLRIEFHMRILTPFLAIIFALFALACMLYGDVPRRFPAKRVMYALLGAVSIQGLTYFFVSISDKNQWALYTNYTLLLSVMSFSIYSLTSKRRYLT